MWRLCRCRWLATSSSLYAQFEELETFARFGARLDEDTRKIIEDMGGGFAPVSSSPNFLRSPCPHKLPSCWP